MFHRHIPESFAIGRLQQWPPWFYLTPRALSLQVMLDHVGALELFGVVSNFHFLASQLLASFPGTIVLQVVHDLHGQEELEVEVEIEVDG